MFMILKKVASSLTSGGKNKPEIAPPAAASGAEREIKAD